MTTADPQSDTDNWLVEVLDLARQEKWCTYHACTTCAADKFRSAYTTALLRDAGVPKEPRRQPHRRVWITELCEEFDGYQRNLVIDALVRGLRGLPEQLTHGTAFRWIILDLNALVRQGNSALYEALEGSHAHAGLQRMVEHSKRLGGR